MSTWTVVVRGDWYLPHLVNMLKQYTGNTAQTSCRDDVVAQIKSQIITESLVKRTRPLVVIDPEDTEAVDRLTKVLVEAADRDGNVIVSNNGIHPDITARALREFADPKPPSCSAVLHIGTERVECERDEHVVTLHHRNDSIGRGVRWSA